jgi:SET domain-containing protein
MDREEFEVIRKYNSNLTIKERKSQNDTGGQSYSNRTSARPPEDETQNKSERVNRKGRI